MRKFAAVIGVIIGLAVVPRVADASPIGTNGCSLVALPEDAGEFQHCDIYMDADVDGSSDLIPTLGDYLPGYVFVLNSLANLDVFDAADVAHILIVHDQLFELYTNSAANNQFARVFTEATNSVDIDHQPIEQIAGCPAIYDGVPKILLGPGLGYCLNQDEIFLESVLFVGGSDTLTIHTAPVNVDTDPHTAPVPEPGTLTLLGLGGAMAAVRRRRAKKAA